MEELNRVRLEVIGKKGEECSVYIWERRSENIKRSRKSRKVEDREENKLHNHYNIGCSISERVRERLMLVDMAGSKNIDQAGQTVFEAKMQGARPQLPFSHSFCFILIFYLKMPILLKMHYTCSLLQKHLKDTGHQLGRLG
ncbi:ubiquitin carboxyl-terminal hydrolase 24 [Iris pallida]|uniref:Ubiquitin carboxyl-terminal hydrolase 24 n=1 Tax=Iris pallida TaxID=29817 RepID=A0AAX6E1W5_IRIPA|nr:ubiquitin carboxyl-terminal hydrolase 24 [Iris pallida]